jgi:hypothetical protein
MATWKDHGDLDLSYPVDPFVCVEDAISGLLKEGIRVLTLGGDCLKHRSISPLISIPSTRHSLLESRTTSPAV